MLHIRKRILQHVANYAVWLLYFEVKYLINISNILNLSVEFGVEGCKISDEKLPLKSMRQFL